MSINVVEILNNFSKNISSAGFQQNYANRPVDENIFAQAKEIVSKYKTEKENNSTKGKIQSICWKDSCIKKTSPKAYAKRT